MSGIDEEVREGELEVTRGGFIRWSAAVGSVILAPQLVNAARAVAQSPSSGRVVSAEEAAQRVLAMARRSVAAGSRGVGGLIMENSSGKVVAVGRNQRYRPVAKSVASIPDEVLTWDYTAHGETGLVGWYEKNRRRLGLPDPHRLTVVTTLDPCAMCTGSILSGGFSAAAVALDPTGGMNITGDLAYDTLPANLRPKVRARFGFYAIEGERAYSGGPSVPLRKTPVSAATADACRSVFFDAPKRDLNPFDDVPLDRLVDPRTVPARDPLRRAMRKAWPDAFSIRLENPRRPTAQLRRYLEGLKRGTRGATNAVAFIDPFGNLLCAAPDTPARGAIATAFMNTSQAYARTRFQLFNDPATHDRAKACLTMPSYGTLIWLHAPTPGLATTIKDLGAYGSTVGRPSPGNFQYFLPPLRGGISRLRAQIAALPPFYTETVRIEPMRVGSVSASAAVDERPAPVPYPAYP